MSFTRLELDEIARSLTARPAGGTVSSDERILRRLTGAVVAGVPGADYAGLTLVRDGALISRAPSDPFIADLEQLQTDLDESPGREVLGTGVTVTVDDAREEGRWSGFSAAVAAAGLRSLLCFPASPHPASTGVLTLYSPRAHAFDAASRTIAVAFAVGAAVAVDGARAVAGLERALQTRDAIGQAKGILMERFGLDPDSAFALLVEASQQTNAKLADVARWLVDETVTTRTTETTETTETTTRTTSTETTTRRRTPGRPVPPGAGSPP